ncbi:diacylglycerol kinase [Cereibacter johrii]|uniref:Diacylglycerol kinase n=1 Tax=Cereibacter johrii TaxID=445629 RepID=A0ABX5J5E7_9RHOB|nr:diacylglycerol kinase [Cereibacter johrii]QCP87656.1 diacylglycerol kinase [Cereibacter sphaeroides]RDS95363.1 diacylglycerol kinase [Cereibacter sphaeroides f. sp. denitrificans]MEA5160291.1 diacylglycerol kinase [Cereibacter johrii]ODM41810.1 diacylglycerol kinase [Cereibacter johrii]PTM78141.1 diacylglycerol kinase [Cereibacter johrii]
MTDRTDLPRPPQARGARHLLAAARHSTAGLRRLLQETAFRHELAGGAAGLALLLAGRATLPEILGAAVLFLLLVAAEALNTAIEVVVDHLAPGWAEFARDAKDLGSLAVLCLILANVAFVAYAILG